MADEATDGVSQVVDEVKDEQDGEEELLARHRKEKKDLQAKIQALKKSATKGDKKKKKEVTEEIAKLESEMDTRHEAELKQFKESAAVVTELTDDMEDVKLEVKQPEQRVTKAQKRRDKKVDQAKERERLVEEQEKANLEGARHVETEKIKQTLAKMGLTFHEIPSDGNCMYAAIAHQMNGQQTVQQLRCLAASFMRSRPDDFMPFMDEVASEEQYMKYCDDVQRTSAWGSQLELRALSEALRRPFKVIQSEGRPVLIGEEFNDPSSDKQPQQQQQQQSILLTYHRHMFGLGEHYNSVRPLTTTDTGAFDDASDPSC